MSESLKDFIKTKVVGTEVILTLDAAALAKAVGHELNKNKESEEEKALTPLRGKKIVLDVGHGYNKYRDKFDVGASNPEQNIDEYDLNLHMAEVMQAELTLLGAQVDVLKNNKFVERKSLYDRYRYAEKVNADAFISLHHNAFIDPDVQGTETLYRTDFSEKLAEYINDEMVKMLGFRNRGAKKKTNLGVIKSQKVVSVLTEPYFLTNSGITSENCLQMTTLAARGAVKGLVNYFA